MTLITKNHRLRATYTDYNNLFIEGRKKKKTVYLRTVK